VEIDPKYEVADNNHDEFLEVFHALSTEEGI
jgi:hypothetical protein